MSKDDCCDSSALKYGEAVEVYKELPLDEFKNIVSSFRKSGIVTENKVVLIVKFGADWCRPCKLIKPICDKLFNEMPDNVICFDIDIDETMDLYMALKKYKMVSGVPCILAYFLHPNRSDTEWYIPNDSVIGGNPNHVEAFFARCKKHAINLSIN